LLAKAVCFLSKYVNVLESMTAPSADVPYTLINVHEDYSVDKALADNFRDSLE
jgi:hypothetical protein